MEDVELTNCVYSTEGRLEGERHGNGAHPIILLT